MKNNEQQILDEIKSMMISIRQQIELLDAKMAELQKITSPADSAADPIDLDISSFDVVEVDDDLPFDEPEAVAETQPVAESVTLKSVSFGKNHFIQEETNLTSLFNALLSNPML